MIGYNYNDTEMQPSDDEDAFILAEENIIEALVNNGFETVAIVLSCSEGWVTAINTYLAEQNNRRNEI